MIRCQLEIKGALIFSLLVAITIMITLGGCKSQGVDYQKFFFDLAVVGLTDMTERDKLSDRRRRSEVALSKLKNGIPDTKPILIHSVIGFREPNVPALNIIYFDEDADLRGLRIKEHYIDPNGTITILEEDYPVFVNTLDTLILENILIPIQIRDKNQRKDKCLWLEYVNWNLDELIRLYIDKQQNDSGDIYPLRRGVPWKKPPPIYISVPDPNRVKVLISAYDRAGNESDSIELLAPPKE